MNDEFACSEIGEPLVKCGGREVSQESKPTRIDSQRGRGPVLWLVVVSAIGAELFYAFGLFQFG